MSGGGNKAARKLDFFDKLKCYLDRYSKVVVVGADNVGSNQMQLIRRSLRGTAEILMGKNTLIRRVLRGYTESNPIYEDLSPLVRNNVGFVFTNGDLAEVQEKLLQYRIRAPAKEGSIAPNDVFVRRGPTGLEPMQTAFFHALNIPSRISMGQIEICSDVHLLRPGEKVSSSHAALLKKLNIKPFAYGLTLLHVYDASSGTACVYDPALLRMSHDDVIMRLRAGIANVAALSLACGYPTAAALPHALAHAYADVLAVAVETDYAMPGAQGIKDYLANPYAYAAPALASASASAPAPARVVEFHSESEDEMDTFGLFD